MQSQLCMSLFYFSTLLAIASCAEFHGEYEAVHQQALHRRQSHRLRPDRHVEANMMQVALSAHDQRVINISTALEDYSSEYIGTIGVGTNSEGKAQFEARVVFDTGSTNLWVASTLCKAGPCNSKRGAEFYDPAKSLTQESFVQEEGKILDIKFGTGELKGPFHVDHMFVGPMVIKKQPFAMIQHMTGSVFSSFPFEGILGLGFKSLSASGIDPFFDHVIGQKLLANNEFAFFMNVDSDKPSALLWGGVDKDLYHGPIRMFPVVQPHYWGLELLDVKLGNTSMKSAGIPSPVKRLIVDSGTTYFTAPDGLKTALVNKMEAENYPPMTFVLKSADGEPYDLVVSKDTYLEGGSPAFMSLDVPKKYGPGMLLGEVFMKKFFTVFSRGDGKDENAKVGFAPANTDATPKVKALVNPASDTTSVLEFKARKAGGLLVRRDIRQHH